MCICDHSFIPCASVVSPVNLHDKASGSRHDIYDRVIAACEFGKVDGPCDFIPPLPLASRISHPVPPAQFPPPTVKSGSVETKQKMQSQTLHILIIDIIVFTVVVCGTDVNGRARR